MLDAFLQGGARVFEPIVLLWILAGTIIGVVIGIIPAIGSLLTIALLIPFVYGMPPEIGLGFLVALASVVFTGGSMTSILLGIPGTGGNVATIFDGFMMTRKGEGPLAIGAALAASMFGGIVAVPMALVMIPLVVPLIVAFRTPEMFFLIALGLAFMSTVSVGSMVRGLISGLFGILIALVGTNAMTGTQRFTFGSLFLYQGIDLVTIVLGLWGIAGLLDIMTKEQPTVSASLLETKPSALLQGAKLLWYHKLLWFRSSVIGYIVGVIPGIGASVATFMAYGQAKQASKHPDKFGKGCVEGVIAPESANNAKEAGGLLTTMVFGIPGDPDMAVMMGAFFMVGVIPGPPMMKEHLPLAFTLLIGIAVANILAGIACFSAAPYLIKVARVSKNVLFPVITVVILAGALATRASMLSGLTVMVFGILGFLMIQFDYSRPALTLGFVLGSLFEEYLYQALKLHGPLFFLTPISLVLIAMMVLLFTQPLLRLLYRSLKEEG